MKTAITYGTFDMFHIGHLNIIRRIREHCDRLIVAVSTDEFNAGKGKKAFIPFEDRVEIVKACRYVDKVIPETSWEQKREDILREKADIFVIGDDWKGKFDHLSDICSVMYLSRTPGVSSTMLRKIRASAPDE